MQRPLLCQTFWFRRCAYLLYPLTPCILFLSKTSYRVLSCVGFPCSRMLPVSSNRLLDTLHSSILSVRGPLLVHFLFLPSFYFGFQGCLKKRCFLFSQLFLFLPSVLLLLGSSSCFFHHLVTHKFMCFIDFYCAEASFASRAVHYRRLYYWEEESF